MSELTRGKFQYRYHWLLGLDEYYQWTGAGAEKYTIANKALYHGNWWRIRDVLTELILRDDIKDFVMAQSWVNTFLREHVDINLVKPQNVVELLYYYMDKDPLISRLRSFMWSYLDEENPREEFMPDLGDYFSRGQVKSKLWLMTELAKVVDGPLGNVVFYGGWHNFIAHMLFDQFDVNKIYSIDLDPECKTTQHTMYADEIINHKFEPVLGNVNDIKWNDNKRFLLNDREFHANIVINTSCEHMDNTWFESLPAGTFVLLQTNDYFENEQHSNCCKDLEEAKQKYPMQNIFYEGSLDTELYNRFMLIGIK